jgi:hypothetical protein
MIGHAIGRACDHPAASSSMCVFIPRPDRPPAPLTRLSHTRSRRLPRRLAAPSGQPPPRPPLSQGAAATVGNNLSTDNAAAPPSPAHPRLCHHRRPSPLLQTAPDGIFDSASDCANARKEESTRWTRMTPDVCNATGARKIYCSKLCYMSSSKIMLV